MGIKIAAIDSNKVYHEGTEVLRVYEGANLVLDNSAPPFNSGYILNGTVDGGDTTNITLDAQWSVDGETLRFAGAGTAGTAEFALSTAVGNVAEGYSFTLSFDLVSDGTQGRLRINAGNTGSELSGFTTYTEGAVSIPLTIDTGSDESSIIITGSSASPSPFTIDNVSLIAN